MKRKLLALLLIAAMSMTLLAGCGGGSNGGSDSTKAEYEWKMALNSTAGDNAYDMGQMFADKVEELTEGKVKVTLYGGASLGATSEVLEGMSNGVADVMVESIGTLGTFSSKAYVEAVPYMINSYDHFMKVWNSELGTEIMDTVGSEAGFKLMGAGFRGARIVTATKEMKNIEDFKGFKLRAPNLDMYIQTWQYIGATPTPMAMSDVYTALQQKQVEGQENPMVDSLNYSFDEVCDYWIKTNHVYGCNVVIMDEDYFNSLPEDIQSAVIEASEYAGKEISAQQTAKDEQAEQQLKDAGKTVIEVDTQAFIDYYKDFASEKFPDLNDWVTRIKAMAE